MPKSQSTIPLTKVAGLLDVSRRAVWDLVREGVLPEPTHVPSPRGGRPAAHVPRAAVEQARAVLGKRGAGRRRVRALAAATERQRRILESVLDDKPLRLDSISLMEASTNDAEARRIIGRSQWLQALLRKVRAVVDDPELLLNVLQAAEREAPDGPVEGRLLLVRGSHVAGCSAAEVVDALAIAGPAICISLNETSAPAPEVTPKRRRR